HPAQPLEAGDWPASDHALPAVGNGVIKGGLGATDTHRRDRRPVDVQRLECQPEARALLAEHVLLMHAEILEKQLDVGHAVLAHLAVVAADDEAWAGGVDDEGADPRTPRTIAGTSHHERILRYAPPRDEAFLAVDNPRRPVLDGTGGHGRGV